MSISGNYPPSKTVVLARTGLPTLTLQASTLWYLYADPANPANMVVRYQDPLSPAASNIIFASFTGVADTVAPTLGLFVKVTPINQATFSGYPAVPFWFNICLFKNLEDRGSVRKLTLGSANASEILNVSESYASLKAAIDSAAAAKTQNNLVNVVPAGIDQGTATRVPIVRGQGNYTIFIGGISTPTARGIRLEMVAEDGVTVIPPVEGTMVTLNNTAILQPFVNVYPQTGRAINGAALDAPYVFDNGGVFTLIATRTNQWAIMSNEFGKIEADTIYQNNTAARLGLGDPAGQGVFIDALGAAPVQLAIRDAAIGLTVNTNTTQLQGIQNGVPAFTLNSDATFQVGGVAAGQEGKIIALALNVVATDPPVVVSPAMVINITSATGAAPGIRFDGSAGMLTLVNNGSAGNATVTTDGGTVFATLAAAESGLVMSSDNGTSWGLVATFPIAP